MSREDLDLSPSPRSPRRRPGSDSRHFADILADTEKSFSSAKFLAESARDLNSTLEIEEVFGKIADRVHLLLDYSLFCIMLWNEETRLLEHSYSLRFGEHIEQPGGFALRRGISGHAAAERRPIRCADVREDPRYVRFRHSEVEIRSELAVPLVLKERLIGVLDLESTELDTFTEEHEQILSALASHMATALENARLYESVRASRSRLESEIATAREIQKGLLPQEPPRVGGLEIGAAFLPARELSGDFYDFLQNGDGRIAFSLGDVAGKATPAALFGSLAVGVMRGQVLQHFAEPSKVLERINQHLLPVGQERHFVAMLYAVYEPASRTLTVGNAGVPRPFLLREGKVERIHVVGVPLGALPDSGYAQVSTRLEKGDLLVFCSDGIEDSTDESGDYFGDERIEKFLYDSRGAPAARIAKRLLAEAGRFSQGSPDAADDRTVIAVRVV